MFERRLNPILLEKLLAEGKSQSQAARSMGFSKQAVSKFLQRQKGDPKPVPVKTGPTSEFEGLKSLKKIMSTVVGELKYLDGEIKTSKGEIRERLNSQRLNYLKECRKQLSFILEIDERRFSLEEVQRFQNFVLEKIGEIDETTREQILESLRRGKSFRRLLNQG